MTLRITALPLLALAMTTTAFALEGTQDFANQTLSTRSRNEVRIELAQARAVGELENRGQTVGLLVPSSRRRNRARKSSPSSTRRATPASWKTAAKAMARSRPPWRLRPGCLSRPRPNLRRPGR
jgi:Domain of unknown function (DUF4148)